LLWSVWSFAAKPLPEMTEALPVDLVTASEFSQITAGSKDAKPAEKPLAEKVAEQKLAENTSAKVAEKEVNAAREPPPAPPEPKPPEAKPPEAKPPEAKPAEVKSDPTADKLKEEAKKPEPKKPEPKKAEAKTPKAEAKMPMPPRKPAPPAPKFDPQEMQALLDKRDSTRVATAGNELNNEPSLGLADGHAAQLAQNEFNAFIRRIEECWHPPPGVNSTTRLSVIIRVLFKNDGTVARPPELVSGPASALGPAMAESAKRAIMQCQPFKMLNPERYEQWKDIEINFDPKFMLRG
jgi:colicin import membrane protein